MHLLRWTRRLRDAHPDHHAIARGMGLVVVFAVLASLARAAKEVAIAYRYGVSAEVDAYLFVLNLVSWPVGVWFSSLTVVLIPLVVQIRLDAPADLPRFRSELLGFTLSLGLGLAAVSLLVLPLLQSSWTGLPDATRVIALGMVAPLALLAPLGVLIGVLSAWMMTAGRHANTLFEGVPAITILLALLTLFNQGVEPLVWGTVAGFVLHCVSLATSAARQGELDRPRFSRESRHWTAFWQGFGVMLVGQILMSLTTIIDQFFAAHLDTGSIATLGYANRLLTLILGIGAMAVSRATLPVFSLAQAQGGDLARRVAMQWVKIAGGLGLLAMSISWLLAPWGVMVLFERGAFTPQDTVVVTEVLRYGLLQLPLYFSSLVLVSLLVSQRKYRIISLIGALNLVTKAAFSAVAVSYFGVAGLMVSTSLMLLLSWILLTIAVYKRY